MANNPDHYEEIIYGVPLEDEDCFAQPVAAEFVFPAAFATSAAYSYSLCDHSATVFAENDFDDVIEILAHFDEDQEAFPAVTASPVATAHGLPVASAQPKASVLTYAIPHCYAKEGVEAQPLDFFDDLVLAEADCSEKGLESVDLALAKSLEDFYQHRRQRTVDVPLLAQKRRKKRAPLPPAHGSLHDTVSYNARQAATAKREREHGKFKKARTKWVSVAELFAPASKPAGR